MVCFFERNSEFSVLELTWDSRHTVEKSFQGFVGEETCKLLGNICQLLVSMRKISENCPRNRNWLVVKNILLQRFYCVLKRSLFQSEAIEQSLFVFISHSGCWTWRKEVVSFDALWLVVVCRKAGWIFRWQTIFWLELCCVDTKKGNNNLPNKKTVRVATTTGKNTMRDEL